VAVDGRVQAGRRPCPDAVGAHRRGADDRFGDGGEYVPDPLADDCVRTGQALGEPAHGDRQRDEADQDQQGELPGVDRHDRRGHDQLAQADQAQDTAPLHEHRQLVDVAGDPGDQGPAPLPLLVQHREVVDVPEGAHPQVGQRGLRRPEEPDVHPVDRDGGDHHDHRAEQDELGDDAQIGAARRGEAAVDDLLDGDRHDHPAGGGDQRERERGGQATAELRHHPQPAAQRGHGALGAGVRRQRDLAHATTSACEYARTRAA
jgi:hypothetical protein